MLIPPIIPFAPKKQAFRAKAEAERRAAAKKRPDAGKHAARIFLDAIAIPQGGIISLFCSFRDEIDTWPLAEALMERGHRIALPVTVKKRQPLIFRAYAEGDELRKDAFGVLSPLETAQEVVPAIVVTPLLAFTRNGDRLGYGGGYYDRTLASLRRSGDVLAVGFAYGAQEVDTLPTEDHDQRLDWIVTEREAISATRRILGNKAND